MLLYLDCCCLNRPFDDHSQVRVQLEAAAVEWILEECLKGRHTLATSDYLILELLRNPDRDRREKTLAMTHYSSIHIPISSALAQRAQVIEKLGFKPFDALHLAAAESSGCDFFLTTDDRLLKNATRHRPQLSVTLQNPLHFTALS